MKQAHLTRALSNNCLILEYFFTLQSETCRLITVINMVLLINYVPTTNSNRGEPSQIGEFRRTVT